MGKHTFKFSDSEDKDSVTLQGNGKSNKGNGEKGKSAENVDMTASNEGNGLGNKEGNEGNGQGNEQMTKTTEQNKLDLDKLPQINSEADLGQYLQKLRNKNKHDPRPDITKDHNVWCRLLKTAESTNIKGYSLLHFLRCAGCRLKVDRGQLKLDLQNSPELLDMYINDQKLQKTEQLAMNFGLDQYKQKKRRNRNQRRAKQREKLRQEAVEKVKKQLLKDNVRELKEAMVPVQKEVQRIRREEYGVGIKKLNEMWGDEK